MLNKTILSKNKRLADGFKHQFAVGEYWVATQSKVYEENGAKLIIDGYVLPRTSYFEAYKDTPAPDMIFELFNQKGAQFIHCVKGIFTVFLFKENKWWAFTDPFSLLKLFLYQSDRQFFLSNDFKLIADHIQYSQVNVLGVMGNTLFNHYVNGQTFIQGLNYLPQASCVSFDEKQGVKTHTYWKYESLMELSAQKYSYKQIAAEVEKITAQYLAYLKPAKTAISLTGGKDSRTILAALIKLKNKPFAFTYGNKNTSDSSYAQKIAKGLELDYAVFSSDLSTTDLWTYYNKIIEAGNPLINIHRAHRLKAFDSVLGKTGKDTCFWGGYLGGEFLMGIYYDDLIFTSFVRERISKNTESLDVHLQKKLSENYSKTSPELVSKLSEQVSELKAFKPASKRVKEFHAIMDIGVLHHAQDMQLMMEKMNFMIPFFLDIDLLHLIFSSRFSMLNVNNETRNIYKRQNLFSFNLNIQHRLAPVLDRFYFAKKGSFNTREFIYIKPLLPVLRLYRKLFVKHKFAQPIYYKSDYQEKIYQELKKLQEQKNHKIHQYFDIDAALMVLENQKLGTTEKYWHPFTNLLTLAKQFEMYFDEVI